MRSLKPYRPLLLSLLMPGLGHAALGKSAKGIFLFCLFASAVPLFSRLAVRVPASLTLAVVLVGVASALGVFGYAAFDAFRCGRAQFRDGLTAPVSPYAILSALIIGYALILSPLSRDTRENVIELYRVPTKSMAPAVAPGSYVFADKRIHSRASDRHIRRGDIIVFVYPDDRSRTYIKRVAGLPGDRIDPGTGELIANGASAKSEQAGAETVPHGHVFVLADDLEHGKDSRRFGPVPLRDILGIALL